MRLFPFSSTRDASAEAAVETAITPHRTETFPPVTLGHIRGHGCRDLLVYCESTWCNHSATLDADWLPDETPVRSLCRRMSAPRTA